MLLDTGMISGFHPHRIGVGMMNFIEQPAWTVKRLHLEIRPGVLVAACRWAGEGLLAYL